MENQELIPVKEKGNIVIEELLETQNHIVPLVNIYETDNEFVLTAHMPGVERQNVRVKLDGNSLIMFGQIDYNNKIDKKYILNEAEIGNYFRTFKISNTVDKSKIEAKYDYGLLTLTLPKIEEVRPRAIDVM